MSRATDCVAQLGGWQFHLGQGAEIRINGTTMPYRYWLGGFNASFGDFDKILLTWRERELSMVCADVACQYCMVNGPENLSQQRVCVCVLVCVCVCVCVCVSVCVCVCVCVC